MAVSSTKLKTLELLKILMEKTDEDHIMSAADLIRELEKLGFSADRKSIYNDIETFIQFGADIEQVIGGPKQGYYVSSRDFELPEVKLLVDAVQSSKFISVRKSRDLIGKIEKLVSENQAKQLQRNVFIANRNKTGNETVYYNVDQIHLAIYSDRQIRFQYSEWDLNKKLVPKKDGRFYVVSPWALAWEDENYYLIAYEEETGKIKHYRVDKMRNTSVTEDKRLGEEQFRDFDLAAYTRKTFGMYGGRDEKITLLCGNSAIGIMIDRFGRDVTVIPRGKEHFLIKVTVSVSPQFFGWIASLGGDVLVEEPAEVKEEYREFLNDIISKMSL